MCGTCSTRLVTHAILLVGTLSVCIMAGSFFDPNRSGDSFGRQYFVLLPTEVNTTVPVMHNIFISSKSAALVQVNISRPSLPSKQWRINVQPNIVANVTLNMTGYQYVSTGVGHQIEANDDVAVWVTPGSGGNILGGYRAIPLASLGKNYVSVLYPSAAFTSEVVIYSPSNEDNEIQLHHEHDNLTVTIDATTSILPTSFSIPAKDSARIVSASDLSGLALSGTQAISVTSGRNCRVRTSTEQQGYQCDSLAEQLPPLEAWGQSFVVVPQSLTGVEKLRVVSAFNNTAFSAFAASGDQLKTWSMSGEHVYVDVHTNVTGGSPFTLRASKPISVTHFFTDGRKRLDYASMVALPPVEQYTNSSVTFPALNHTIFKNYLVIVTKCTHRRDIILDNKNITNKFQYSVRFTVEPDSSVHGLYCTLNITIQSGSHTLRLRNNAFPGAAYSAFLYGVGATVAYAYPVAADLREIVCDVIGEEVELCNFYVPPDFTTPLVNDTLVTTKGPGGPNEPTHRIIVVVVLVVLCSLALIVVIIIVIGNCGKSKGPKVAWRRFQSNGDVHYDADFAEDDDINIADV